MIKYFCDICGQEINETFDRLRSESRSKRGLPQATLGLEIVTSKDGVSNAGHFCKYCIIEAVNQMDDRPRAA